ncbi:MAG: methionine biosynthesis protein MetW [Candidatus Margulisiibacteriota bacterium]
MIEQTYQQRTIELIKPGSTVLDLGCGDGAFLAELARVKQVKGYGIDIDFSSILDCVKKGLSVFQGNIEEGLKEFSSQSFDYVILSHTLQQIHNPLYVLSEMLRVGRKAIVTFPNFAHWKIRLALLQGASPKSKSLPFEWYNTPNIRVITVHDFRVLCQKENIQIEAEIPLYDSPVLSKLFGVHFTNLLANKGMFVLMRDTGFSI